MVMTMMMMVMVSIFIARNSMNLNAQTHLK